MIARTTKLLFLAVFLAALLSAEGAGRVKSTMTKEKLLAARQKKVVHLEHAMAMVQKQLDEFHKGTRRMDQQRVKSLRNRLASYKGQIYDYSKKLSEEEIASMLRDHSEL
eukprot:jgi/Psemu1/287222/fgenesh1_pg.180_\